MIEIEDENNNHFSHLVEFPPGLLSDTSCDELGYEKSEEIYQSNGCITTFQG